MEAPESRCPPRLSAALGFWRLWSPAPGATPELAPRRAAASLTRSGSDPQRAGSAGAEPLGTAAPDRGRNLGPDVRNLSPADPRGSPTLGQLLWGLRTGKSQDWLSPGHPWKSPPVDRGACPTQSQARRGLERVPALLCSLRSQGRVEEQGKEGVM